MVLRIVCFCAGGELINALYGGCSDLALVFFLITSVPSSGSLPGPHYCHVSRQRTQTLLNERDAPRLHSLMEAAQLGGGRREELRSDGQSVACFSGGQPGYLATRRRGSQGFPPPREVKLRTAGLRGTP